jgi:hypothetical protein
MRMILGMLALGVFSSPAFADAKSYCEVFSQDFASAKTSDVDEWQKSFRSALGDCMAQYAAQPKAAPPLRKSVEKVSKKVKVFKKVVVVPATSTSKRKRTRILEPGSHAWVTACSAKYASFDSGTGNYKSNSGKLRRCSL